MENRSTAAVRRRDCGAGPWRGPQRSFFSALSAALCRGSHISSTVNITRFDRKRRKSPSFAHGSRSYLGKGAAARHRQRCVAAFIKARANMDILFRNRKDRRVEWQSINAMNIRNCGVNKFSSLAIGNTRFSCTNKYGWSIECLLICHSNSFSTIKMEWVIGQETEINVA